ncbi:hypothetical protein COU60_00805 [Candidatus Pacearchaeota archaeon CG10_big_fil_rev_8_21_14_0_10_34_76]|nr:MAG: hypothetical protein COU60_00805 [Candidatus Pacearchaeota archaeon CG10_big_fil_rev_8_21_14_0_10_34_76]
MDQKLKDKKILITGGLGFIGSNLARRAVEEGAEVTLFVRSGKSLENIQDIKEKVSVIEGEISKNEDLEKAVKDKNYIFHFAWQTDLKKSMANPEEDISEDLVGVIKLLEVCKNHNKDAKIIFASSVTVIGETDKLSPNELDKENPLSIYEANKLIAEKYLKIYYDVHGIKSTVLRISNVFGERQRIDNPNRGILNFMIGRALRGEDLTVYGDGEFVRDYCYIQNYMDAFILSAISDKTNGEVFTLGSGEGRTFNEVVRKIKEIVEEMSGKNVKITHVPFPEGENKINKRNFIADFSKFTKSTGWKPEISFENGLRRTIEFYYNKGYK